MAEISDNPFHKSTFFAGRRLHLGVGGSIACYKACDLLRAFSRLGISVAVTLSQGARHFVSATLFEALGATQVYGEMFAENSPVFGHLEPGQIADALLIAPASANGIASLAQGRADAMLYAQALAFDGPIVIAPAMNPRMWVNAATRANVELLQARAARVVAPDTGQSACGETGQGRLAKLPEIFLNLLKALAPQDLAGYRVMVTLGPTREAWDGMRFLSNPSTGLMGAALATCAWLRGAHVTAICGPIHDFYLPGDIVRHNVNSAAEMLHAAEKIWQRMDWGIFCAAVADFAPLRPQNADNLKIHKDCGVNVIELGRTPDILATLASQRQPGQKLLAFAAEIVPDMQELLKAAGHKLAAKGADLLAANRINQGQGAFGAEDNQMAVLDKAGRAEIWPARSKADVAWELLSWFLTI